MNFTITSRREEDLKMFPGMIITYKVTPLKGIRLNWVTEITHVKEREYFIDEQRFGPYAFWKHQHRFVEIPSGVKLIDNLYYALPFGFFGRQANSLFVEKQIRKIFNYRSQKISEIFGIYKA